MPPMTPVPMARWLALAAPLALKSGHTPRMKANEVIKIGRKRWRAPSTVAACSPAPRNCASFANSMMRMAFLVERPMMAIMPMRK